MRSDDRRMAAWFRNPDQRAGVFFALGWLLLLLLYFSPVLTTGRVLAVGDGFRQDFPMRLLVAQALAHGFMPFWNPFIFGGHPLLPTIHVGIFYPGNWFFLFLPPVWALNLTVISAFWVAAMGMGALLRALGLSWGACWVGALAFTLSGFMVCHIENVQIIQAASLLPVWIWSLLRFTREQTWRNAGLASTVLALQIFAGHPQMTVFTGLVGIFFIAWHWREVPRTLRARYGVGLCGIAAMGLGLSAMQWLPTVLFIPETQRAAIAYLTLFFRSLPPRQIVTGWFPFFFGSQPGDIFRFPYWGAAYNTELTFYAGMATVLLATVAVLHRSTRRASLFWVLVVVAGFLFATGDQTPLFFVWTELPILRSLPGPGRHLLEVNFAWAVLAAYGFGAWRSGTRQTVWRAGLLSLLPMLALLGWVMWRGQAFAARAQAYLPAGMQLSEGLRLDLPAFWVPVVLLVLTVGLLLLGAGSARRRWPVLLCGLLMGDLVLFGYHQSWHLQAAKSVPALPAAADVQRIGGGRVLMVDALDGTVGGWTFLGENGRSPNWDALAGVRSVSGYDAFVRQRHSELFGNIGSDAVLNDDRIWRADYRGLDLLGVGHLIIPKSGVDTPHWQRRLKASRWQQVADQDGLVTYRNRQAMPRAWRAQLVFRDAPQNVRARVLSEVGLDFYRDVLVETGNAPQTPLNGWHGGPVILKDIDWNTLDVSSMGNGPGLVVINEGYARGWQAFSGARALPVYPVDGGLIGVVVPSGVVHVTLRYTPPGWWLGLILSGVSLLAMVFLHLRERMRCEARVL